MPYTNAVFTIEAIASYFHGYTEGTSWHGSARPLYPFEEAQRLLALNNATDFCGHLRYDPDQDAFLFHEFGLDHPEPPVAYFAVISHGQKLYPIGAGSWCWEDVSQKPAAHFSAQLVRELAAMQLIGLPVPPRAFMLACDVAEMEDLHSMKVADAADLIVQLATQD
jgi:hypothetical protein